MNLEVDVIARYLERLLQGDAAANPDAGGISEAFLAEHGFMFEEFLAHEADAGRLDLPLRPIGDKALLHGHCHDQIHAA